MHTLRVVEGDDDWRVERDGEVIFRAAGEERCFLHALETSSKMFDDGLSTEVTLKRLA